MTRNPIFSIIIPTRNERNNLIKLLPVLIKLYPQTSIWIIDDNSTDGTFVFLKDLSNLHPHVHILIRQNRHGRGSAVMDGLKEAYKDKKILYFLEMDADLSHSPAEIQKLLIEVSQGNALQSKALPYKEIIESVTVVIGSRHIAGAKFINCSPIRIFLSHLANWFAGLILSIPKTVRHPRGSPQGFPWGGGNRITDYTNGFRLYPREAVKVLLNSPIRENGYIMLSETAFILYKNGFKFIEVPTMFVNRTEGKSNATITEFLKSLVAVLKIRFSYTF